MSDPQRRPAAPAASAAATDHRWGVRAPVALGLVALVLLVGGFGSWAVQARIAGAILAPGRVEVDRNRQTVQHPDGGQVAEVATREGAEVGAGDLLIRLDDATLRPELSVVESQLFELIAREARLLAERDDLAALPASTGPGGGTDPDADTEDGRAALAAAMAGQRRLFGARLESLLREREQLRQRQSQIDRQIEGIAAQRAALSDQRALIAEELATQEELLARGLAQAARVLSLRREAARLDGEIGALTARAAEARERATELDTRILTLDSSRREEATAELRDVQARLFELRERRRALRQRLARLDIRAPVAGTVHGLAVSGPGAVIRAADPLLSIVPSGRPLTVTVRISATDIDSVRGGQTARLRLPALDTRSTPELTGRVLSVSADAFTDENTGASYYRGEILPDPGEMAGLGDQSLIPGMPVEAYLTTAERTPMAYLLKPLTDQISRTFREE